ncbi:EthD domain-containing protein [Mucilaginibacter sp.]
MIKFTILLKKRADMTTEEFVAYHRNQHAPLFKSLPEVQQYVRRYVQGHLINASLPGLPPPKYDGTTELWFDDAASIGKVFAASRYMEIIRPDEEKFLDLQGCDFLICAENEVI